MTAAHIPIARQEIRDPGQGNSPLRVFHLIKSLGRGGAETLLVEGLARVDRERMAFGVGYFLPWKDALVEPLRAIGADVVCFPARGPASMLLSIPRVARFLRRWGADVLHCHMPLPGVVGRAAGRLAGVPVVYTEHNVMERYHPWTYRANLATWRLQHHAVAVSRQVADSIRRHAPASVRVTTIENGVPVDTFAPDRAAGIRVRRAHDIPDGAPVVGTVAVFRGQKRLDLWLDAAGRLRRAVPETRFLLVGDGPLRADLEARSRALGLREVVRFAGLQPEVRPYYSAMDVYLLSSDFEGLPLALLEAMATERPVVATAVGGVAEVVVDGETGLLVRRGDVEALAAGAAALLCDGGRRHRMGRAARDRVEERYGIRRMMTELEGVWLSVHRREA